MNNEGISQNPPHVAVDVSTTPGYQADKVAQRPEDVNKKTETYIGPLFENIFKYPNLKNIYRSFPENKIHTESQDAGNRSFETIYNKLDNAGILRRNKNLTYIQINPDWYTPVFIDAPSSFGLGDDLYLGRGGISKVREISKKLFYFEHQFFRKTFDLVHLKVSDLDLKEKQSTLEDIYKKAKYFGLSLCPPEIGPELILTYMDQSLTIEELRSQGLPVSFEDKYIAMKPIKRIDNHKFIFRLDREYDRDTLILDAHISDYDHHYNQEDTFVFCRGKNWPKKPATR